MSITGDQGPVSRALPDAQKLLTRAYTQLDKEVPSIGDCNMASALALTAIGGLLAGLLQQVIENA